MSRKRSIPDSVSAGRSRIVPYYRGEDFRMRHARRLSANLEQEANVRRWCGQRGLTLRITNEGHHWQRSEEHTSELQSHHDLVCRLLLEKKKKTRKQTTEQNVAHHREPV